MCFHKMCVGDLHTLQTWLDTDELILSEFVAKILAKLKIFIRYWKRFFFSRLLSIIYNCFLEKKSERKYYICLFCFLMFSKLLLIISYMKRSCSRLWFWWWIYLCGSKISFLKQCLSSNVAGLLSVALHCWSG
jgi:hypothetical protein